VLGRSLEPLVVRIHMCKNRYGTVPILVFMFGGCSERSLDDLLGAGWLYLVVEKQVNEVMESDREELVLGRSLEPLVVRINMCKYRYGFFLMLVSMVGGCSEGKLDDSLGFFFDNHQ
jgi:hypothetical protein